jgi:hypothetical protein
VLRATCQQLSEQWAVIVERDMPRPKKASMLSRIIAVAKSGKADLRSHSDDPASIDTASSEHSAWSARHV